MSTDEQCVASLLQYFEDFNNHDIEQTLSHLDEELEAYVEQKLATSGRETVRPAYVSDFEAGKKVTVVGTPKVIKDSSDYDKVVQIATKLSTGTMELECIYSLRRQDSKHIRHDISNIVKL